MNERRRFLDLDNVRGVFGIQIVVWWFVVCEFDDEYSETPDVCREAITGVVEEARIGGLKKINQG